MSLYDRLAATPDGARALAKARLRVVVIEALYEAVEACGGEAEFCQRAGIRKRTLRRAARERRDLRITELADWLHAAGLEMTVRLVPAGQPRADVLARREAAKVAKGPSEWGGEETQWTIRVRKPDGSPVELDAWEKPQIGSEQEIRPRFEEMQDTVGYRKVLLRRELGAWQAVDGAVLATESMGDGDD